MELLIGWQQSALALFSDAKSINMGCAAHQNRGKHYDRHEIDECMDVKSTITPIDSMRAICISSPGELGYYRVICLRSTVMNTVVGRLEAKTVTECYGGYKT